MQQPPLLKIGDRLRVIAPSGAIKDYLSFQKGVEVWRSRGYIVDLGEQYTSKEGYLAGKDQIRMEALSDAWQNPDYKAILCARGGYGSTRILEQWQWPEGSPKWIIGFSDITALLWSLAKTNIMGLHGALLTTVGDEPSWSQDRLFSYLETGKISPLKGQAWGNGRATGRLLPANLTVATYLLATCHQPDLNRVILAFEDVSESPYRIDRMLTFWRTLGCFERVSGIALGRFSHCNPPTASQSWMVEDVLSDRLGDLGIPIVSGLPFGHDGVNACLPSGIMAELDGDRGILRFFDQ